MGTGFGKRMTYFAAWNLRVGSKYLMPKYAHNWEDGGQVLVIDLLETWPSTLSDAAATPCTILSVTYSNPATFDHKEDFQCRYIIEKFEWQDWWKPYIDANRRNVGDIVVDPYTGDTLMWNGQRWGRVLSVDPAVVSQPRRGGKSTITDAGKTWMDDLRKSKSIGDIKATWGTTPGPTMAEQQRAQHDAEQELLKRQILAGAHYRVGDDGNIVVRQEDGTYRRLLVEGAKTFIDWTEAESHAAKASDHPAVQITLDRDIQTQRELEFRRREEAREAQRRRNHHIR